MAIAEKGIDREQILSELKELQRGDVQWKSGRAFSLAYHAGDDVLDIATRAGALYQSANALNVEAFPSLRKMQNEVVAMVGDLLNGGSQAAGFMTSGGTESIL